MQKVKIEKNTKKDNLVNNNWMKTVDSNYSLSRINTSIYSNYSKSISIDINPKVIHNYLDFENIEESNKSIEK